MDMMITQTLQIFNEPAYLAENMARMVYYMESRLKDAITAEKEITAPFNLGINPFPT